LKKYTLILEDTPTVKNVFSIDPGYKTSGFTFLSGLDSEKSFFVDIWNAPANDWKVSGVPMSKLFGLSYNRAEYYVSQMPDTSPKDTTLVLEYTSLNQQFSTSLNVLVATFLSMVVERKLFASIVMVPPKTTHWIMDKKKKVKVSELKNKAKEVFPDIDAWVRKKYSLNSHSVDSFLLASACFPDIFLKNGCIFEAPMFENTVLFL